MNGRRCLDIGCSNGSLLLAALHKGAAHCTGVDVSEGRIASAKQLCEGSGIELLVADLASADPLRSREPFDVMFCTDVLEHVGSIPGILDAMACHLASGREARVFVTVFNHLNAGCVASEPHYGVPGMVLVDRDAAAEIWRSVRAQMRSNLDYEVESWPEYASLEPMAAVAGLIMTPHLDRAMVLDTRHAFWTGHREWLADLRSASSAKLEALEMSTVHRALLLDAIDRYCGEAEESHRRFEADLPRASDDEVIAFYLRYYAQPIRFFLSHA
jgi:SAM-dependent methyltransferase